MYKSLKLVYMNISSFKHNIIDTDQTTLIIEKMQGSSQSPREVFMIRPAHFMFNEETAVTNHFQV